MSTSQVLDRTFSLYRRNFLLFAGIAALPPGLVLAAQLLLLLIPRLMTSTALSSRGSVAAIVAAVVAGAGLIAIGICWLVGYALASGASVYAVSRVHLGHSARIGECYRLIRPHAARILGIVVVVSLIIGVVMAVGAACVVGPILLTVGPRGALRGDAVASAAVIFVGVLAGIALVILTLFLSVKFSLCVPACVLEGLGVVSSIKRGWHLSQGAVLRLILIFFLTAIMSWILSLVLSIPYFVGVALFIARKDPAILLPFLIWQHVANFLASALAGPIGTISAALIYYDQRVRKEAFDLQVMMEAIGQPATPTAAAAYPGMG